MVNEIRIERFKAIENETFHVGRFNIFVGANNSGKSSVLQAIQFAVGAAQTGARQAKNPETPQIAFTATPSSFVYLPIKDIEALIHNRALTQNQGSSVFFSDGTHDAKITLKRGKNRNIATTMENSELLRQLMSSQPYCVITPGVSGISISEEYKAKAAVLRSATRGDSNFYLRNILLLLNGKTDAWNKFIEKFSLFFPEYTLNVIFDEEVDDLIEVLAKLPNGIELPIDALGTSALQILQILSYIYFFEPQMIILDEPDTHLHPNNQRKLISVLDEISTEEEIQILLSTHSRHIIDEATGIATFFWMQCGKLYKEILPDDDTDFVQLMLDLGALDKSEFLTNQNIKWVICTEDARVDKDKMLKSILSATGFNLQECAILPYKGCSKIESVVMLSSFVRGFLPNAKMILHRDRDYLADSEVDELSKKLQVAGIYFWATPTTDVEALFVNSEHIKHLYPQLDIDQIESILCEAKQETREDSIRRFVNYVSNSTQDRDYRAINLACEQNYDGHPDRYFYGKKTLGLVKSKLQHILHENLKVYRCSPALYQQALHDFLNN